MFQTTQWSVILKTRAGEGEGRAALERLCNAYRNPVLAYLRRHSASREEAEDLTQGFFLEFIDGRLAASADPARGRFRTYLLAAVRHYLSNARAHAGALKRGGREQLVALADSDELETRADPNESPERTFERTWALTVLARAEARLRQEAAAAGKEELFLRLREFLLEA